MGCFKFAKIKSLSKQAKEFSSQAVRLIEEGKYIEGHNLMRQAVEAGRQCRQLIEQPKIEKGLAIFEQMHQK
jgi:hypothetical protein